MTTGSTDSVLFEWYGRYIGEPDARTDVYAGFGLFFGGIALALCGFVLFLWSATVEPGGDPYWTLRRVAIVSASLGLLTGMVGIVVLLPVSRRALYAAGSGTAVCLVSMAFFLAVYPSNWNVQGAVDYSAQGIALYAGGLATVLAATGAALVAHQIERSRPAPVEEDSPEEISDERVARDIDEAMAGVELSWGGVRRKETRRLAVDTGTDGVPVVVRSGAAPDDACVRRRGRGRRRESAGTPGRPKGRSDRRRHGRSGCRPLRTTRAKACGGDGDEGHPPRASPIPARQIAEPSIDYFILLFEINLLSISTLYNYG